MKEQAGLRRYVLRELERSGPLPSRELEHHAARADERTVWWGTRAQMTWMLELLHRRGQDRGRRAADRPAALGPRRARSGPRRRRFRSPRRGGSSTTSGSERSGVRLDERTVRRAPGRRGRARRARASRSSPRSTASSRTATAPRRSGTSSTGSRCTSRRRSASTATTSSRSCAATGSSAASSRSSTARPRSLRVGGVFAEPGAPAGAGSSIAQAARRLGEMARRQADLLLAARAGDLARQPA